jgi:two-component system, OmpR family, phosphate regulon sensor histidine kinase PhoR
MALAAFGAPAALFAIAGAVIVAAAYFGGSVGAEKRDTALPRPGVEDSLPPRFLTLLDAIPAPIILLDARTEVVAANAAALRAFAALRIGAPLSFALRHPPLLQLLERTVAHGEIHSVDLIEKVPVERSFQVRIEPLPITGAGQEAAMISMIDTTAMQRTEQMRVDFVANASHELRTPLASIMGFVETLQGAARQDDAARERFLAIMSQQGRRMARLIEDLLSLSRIEMSAHVLPDADVDVLDILHGVIDGLSALAQERGVKLESAIDIGRAAIVRGDRDELARVFINLVENAIKYGQDGGRVEISAKRTEGQPPELRISVRDFGPGIAPEHVPRLTERFYRVDVASSRDKGGTGLGLAIVKHILNRHRGRLAIESMPGQGAEFSVILPVFVKSS